MKDRILTFIIGLLAGAIIATVCFIIYENVVQDNNQNMMTDFNKIQFQPGNKNGEFRENDNLNNISGEELPANFNGSNMPTPPNMNNGQMPPQMPEGNGAFGIPENG